MLNAKYIQENSTAVKSACRQKNIDEKLVDRFIELETKQKALLAKTQSLRTKRNKLNENQKQKPDQTTIAKGKKIKVQLAELEQKLSRIETERKTVWLQIPNPPSSDTPAGDEGKDKEKVRKWGDIPGFDFPLKDHIALGELHNLIDIKKGAQIAGFRGFYLKNAAVLLQQAVLHYAMQKLVQKGYAPFTCPVILPKRAFINTGHFPWGQQEAYSLTSEEKKDLYLAGTSEVGMVSYHQDEVLDEKKLPLKYAAITPGYRREIGNYGQDTKGLYRVHEIMKVEQVIFCRADKEESDKLFAELTANAEEILQDLAIPYRVCLMPAGDMGEPQYKKYDIEAWMPSRNEYGEVMSCSQLLDFQSRRANIRYQSKEGEKKYVYTLNNTAIATPRILISLLELNQQKDGSIKIPKVLQPLVGKDKIVRPIFK